MNLDMGAISREINEAGFGRKGDLVTKYAKVLGISEKTLYRKIREVSDSGRAQRADAGSTSLNEETLRLIAGVLLNSVRGNGKQTMDIPTARQILLAQGVDIPVSDSRIAVLLKERGLDVASMKEAEPCVRMRSLHPNHVHQVDPSLCLLYYSPDGEQHIIRDSEAYKNKPFMQGKEKMKLWRYVLVDHYSGTICHRYYQVDGENSITLWEFLQYAWNRKDDQNMVFHGLPEVLICDKGSANTSGAIANALKSLRVKLIPHATENARAKGTVENGNNIIEKLFESRLKLQPVSSVEELNGYAEKWDALFNANMLSGYDSRLSRAKMSRTDLWLKIKTDELIELPEDAASLLIRNSEPRVVTPDLSVSYGGLTYSVADLPGIRPKMEVSVQPILVSPDRKILVTYKFNGEEVADERFPAETDEAGFRVDAPVFGVNFKKNADTIQDKARKNLKALIGDEKKPFIESTGGEGIKALDAIKASDNGLMIPRVGKPLTVTPVAEKRYSITEASMKIRVRTGFFDFETRKLLEVNYPNGPTDKDIDDICEGLAERNARQA